MPPAQTPGPPRGRIRRETEVAPTVARMNEERVGFCKSTYRPRVDLTSVHQAAAWVRRPFPFGAFRCGYWPRIPAWRFRRPTQNPMNSNCQVQTAPDSAYRPA